MFGHINKFNSVTFFDLNLELLWRCFIFNFTFIYYSRKTRNPRVYIVKFNITNVIYKSKRTNICIQLFYWYLSFTVTPPPNGNVPLSSVQIHTKHSHSRSVKSEHYPTLSVTSGKNHTTPQKTTCVDSDKYCPGWLNLCHTDEYVKQHCRKSCSFCK